MSLRCPTPATGYAPMPDDPDPLPVGTTGTVVHANAATGQIIVDWDTDRAMAAASGSVEGSHFRAYRGTVVEPLLASTGSEGRHL